MGDQVGTLAVPAAAADSAFGPLGGHAGQQQVMLQAGAGPLPGLTAARMEVCLQPEHKEQACAQRNELEDEGKPHGELG
eukprot:scaffold69968_cov25-Tisochrysis_lutea.AAC.1